MKIFGNNFIKVNIYGTIVLCLLLLVVFCSRKQDSNDPVLARIGNDVITVSEFKTNYEFGLSHLKRGQNPKRTYLDYMIKEKVLSLQGYKLGLDKSELVKRAVNRLRDELVIEELFIQKVHNKINVTEDEIKDALNKSKVSWKFRYWIEPSFDRANQVANAMRERGYSEVVSDILGKNPEFQLSPQKFESDYVTWLDIPSELLQALQELPRGDISNPVELDGVFYIFQITDIRQQGILDSEYNEKAASMKKILFYRKVTEKAFEYMDEFMTPKNVVTKGEAFHILADALIEWKKSGEGKSFPDVIKDADESQEAFAAVKSIFNDPLVQFKSGQWSVKEFIDQQFDEYLLQAKPDDLNALRNQLNDMVALKIRNHFLLKEAEKENIPESANVKQQLKKWEGKWVFEETRVSYTDDLKVDEKQMRDYFDRNKNRYIIQKDREPTFAEYKKQIKQDTYLEKARHILNAKIDSLSSYYPIEINEDVLDTIKTMDSKKSKWMSIQLFKRSSNRLAFPIVDPAWGF